MIVLLLAVLHNVVALYTWALFFFAALPHVQKRPDVRQLVVGREFDVLVRGVELVVSRRRFVQLLQAREQRLGCQRELRHLKDHGNVHGVGRVERLALGVGQQVIRMVGVPVGALRVRWVRANNVQVFLCNEI